MKYKLRRLLAVALAVIPFGAACADDTDAMPHDAVELAAMMGAGWNLGNAMEVPASETDWGNPYTSKETIDLVRNQNTFKTIRIPISWFCRAGITSASDVTESTQIPEFVFERVQQIVDWCLDDGFYVIINEHYDNEWLQKYGFTSYDATEGKYSLNLTEENISRVEAIQKSLWTQIANRFRDYDERLLFAGMNEPAMNCGIYFAASMQDACDRYNQVFVDAVRATGGNNAHRNLIVQLLGADYTQMSYWKQMPTDKVENRLMVELHPYYPASFAMNTSGDMTYYFGDYRNSKTYHNIPRDQVENYFSNMLNYLKAVFIDKGVGVILGEWGCIWHHFTPEEKGAGENQNLHNKSVKAYAKYVVGKALDYGASPIIWDAGGSFAKYQGTYQPEGGIFNRWKNTVFNQWTLDGIKEAADEHDAALGIEGVKIIKDNTDSAVYTIDGRKVADTKQSLNSLPKGIYITGGKKVVVN